MKTTQQQIEEEHLRYSYFIDNATALLSELKKGEKGTICPHYLKEKAQNVLKIVEILEHNKARMARINAQNAQPIKGYSVKNDKGQNVEFGAYIVKSATAQIDEQGK
jgi:hypothetical protein